MTCYKRKIQLIYRQYMLVLLYHNVRNALDVYLETKSESQQTRNINIGVYTCLQPQHLQLTK